MLIIGLDEMIKYLKNVRLFILKLLRSLFFISLINAWSDYITAGLKNSILYKTTTKLNIRFSYAEVKYLKNIP